MNKTLFKKVSAAFLSGALAVMSVPAVPAIAADDDSFKSGYTDDGYYWTIWNDRPEFSTVDMTVGDMGRFESSWNAIQSTITLTVGKKAEEPFDWKETWDQYWDDVQYDLDIQADGISWYGCYGYFESPLVEYCIIDGYSQWVGATGKMLGTYLTDGNMYELYYDTEVLNTGDLWANDDYNLIRISAIHRGGSYDEKGTHAEGEISIKRHFEAWQELGIKNIDKVAEVSMGVYSYNCKGSVKVNENRINTRMEPLKPEPNDPDPAETDSPNCPDEEGYLFNNKFDNGKGGYWGSTDKSEINVSDGVLTVSGRDEYDYVYRKLSSDEFEIGKAYDFSVDVMQDEADELVMDFYLHGFGWCMPVTAEKASATLKKGEWVTLKLENVELPENLNQFELQIKPKDSTAGFSIDNAYGKISTAVPDDDIYVVDTSKIYSYGEWGDYYWQRSGSSGDTKMTVMKNGAFVCSWDTFSEADFTFGKKWPSCPDWTESGKMVYAYEMEYCPESISRAEITGNFSDLYSDAVIDFHICERWNGWDAPGTGVELLGTKTIDGVEYDIYFGEFTSFGVPNYTVWSVRKDGGDAYGDYSGTVTLSDHFAAWEELSGKKLGGLNSVYMNIQGLEGTGCAKITRNEFVSGEPVDLGKPDVSDWSFIHESYKDDLCWYKSSGREGRARMIAYSKGGFSVEWEDADMLACGVGMDPRDCLDRIALDSIVIEYEADCAFKDNSWFGVYGGASRSDGGLNYLCHIVERYGSEGIIGENFEHLGEITVDGSEYDVYIVYPEGGDTLDDGVPAQIWSVRKDGGNADGKYSGAVTVSDHLNAWNEFSEIHIGALASCGLTVRGTDTTGEIRVTKNELIKTPDIPNARLGSGDANCDGKLTIADAAAILQYLGNADKYPLTAGGRVNADFDKEPGITTADAVAIQKSFL